MGWGQYQFLRYDGDARWKTLAGGPTNLLLTGIGKRNAISVEATGDTFSFLINGKAVGPAITVSSSVALSSGEVASSVEEQGTEIVFLHIDIKTSQA